MGIIVEVHLIFYADIGLEMCDIRCVSEGQECVEIVLEFRNECFEVDWIVVLVIRYSE